MDRLEELLATADPLLARIDALLTTVGAPAEHVVWRELRRVRLLPADATRAIAALRPADLTGAVEDLRADARACADAAALLPDPGEWTGEAADTYDDLRRRTVDQLAGGDESLDERLEATADLAQALSDWMTRSRVSVAGALADALDSSEAFTLMLAVPATPPPMEEIVAAADLATRILRPVADAYDDGADLLHGSSGLAVPVPM